MSHVITVSDDTFGKLQALARPFIDTEESVIVALAEAELERRAVSANGNGSLAGRTVLRLDPDSHENLTHARLLSANVDGRPIHRPKWNGLLGHLHVVAHKRLGSFDALRRVSTANLREGKYEESGYRYLQDADLSIQGVDSNLAWDHSLRVARAIEIPIDVRFEWRNKEAAARPGEEAILEWAPQAS